MPAIEDAFRIIRHSGFDLLLWTRRAGRIDSSPLPDQYRAAYAQLNAYTPVFKPRTDALQLDLLEMSGKPGAEPAVQSLISAITHYNGVLDTARSFARVVVDASLELVFQEDWQGYPVERRSRMASEVNDCCQFLPYERSQFERYVQDVRPPLAGGFEASQYTLAVGDDRMLFSVDEAPVFRQLTVKLYRALSTDRLAQATAQLIEGLYREMT